MRKLSNILGIVFLVILIPLLVINCTIIVKSFLYPDEVPFVFGTTMFVIDTDTMADTIDKGDMIICNTVDAEDVEVGDIVVYANPSVEKLSLIVHRVTGITNNNGELLFTTKGDANKTGDKTPVPEEKVMGIYSSRIKGLGNVAMFMRTPLGLVIFVVAPLLLLIAVDTMRTRAYEKKRERETAELLAELESLKEEQEEESI